MKPEPAPQPGHIRLAEWRATVEIGSGLMRLTTLARPRTWSRSPGATTV